jgi:hypothetical protein
MLFFSGMFADKTLQKSHLLLEELRCFFLHGANKNYVFNQDILGSRWNEIIKVWLLYQLICILFELLC